MQGAGVELLQETEEEVLAFYDFPPEHWRQLYSTNPLERFNKELKRWSAVVGKLPTRQPVIRLLRALLAEQNDEAIVARHPLREASMIRVDRAAKVSTDSALVAG